MNQFLDWSILFILRRLNRYICDRTRRWEYIRLANKYDSSMQKKKYMDMSLTYLCILLFLHQSRAKPIISLTSAKLDAISNRNTSFVDGMENANMLVDWALETISCQMWNIHHIYSFTNRHTHNDGMNYACIVVLYKFGEFAFDDCEHRISFLSATLSLISHFIYNVMPGHIIYIIIYLYSILSIYI